MPVASPAQYARRLDAAAAGRYAYQAISISSSQTLNAAVRGLADAGSDGRIQVSTGSGAYAAGSAGDMALGARALADALGTGHRGRYLLAANVHGVHAPGRVRLRPEILRQGQEALRTRHGPDARFQYVFHGGSGSELADIEAAVEYGVVTMNMDSDTRYAFTRAIADHVLRRYDGVLRVDGGTGDKRDYDPRSWGQAAEAAMAQRVGEACRVLGRRAARWRRTAAERRASRRPGRRHRSAPGGRAASSPRSSRAATSTWGTTWGRSGAGPRRRGAPTASSASPTCTR